MKDLINKRIAGMNCAYGHYPFEYFLDSMVRLGIKNIELWGGSPHFYPDDLSREKFLQKKREISNRGLSIVCYTPEQVSYPVNIAAEEDYIRMRSLDYFIRSIQTAAELEAPLMVIVPGWGYLSQDKKQAWEYSRQGLVKLARKAMELGITLALEPLTTISSNLINYAKELGQMLDDVNEPTLKGMLDVGQMGILDETVNDYYEVLGEERLVHVHLVDGSPTGHMAIGDGILPLRDSFCQLINRGYQGYFSLEINDRKYFAEPEEAFRKSLNEMEQWFKQ